MRIGVIGCGSIGRRHIANLLALGERDVMVFDSHEGQKADASGAYDVPLAPRISDLWDWQPTAVLICTPPDSHIRLTAEARIHGAKGIFIEKPLALSPVICAEVMDDCVTMVACNLRFAAGPLAIKRWLDEGRLGQVLSARLFCGYHLPSVRPDYATSYAATTGAILDIGSHEVDMATWLLGPPTLKGTVMRSATSIGLPGVDGMAEMLLEHEGGVVSSVYLNFIHPYYQRSIQLTGTKAVAIWWWDGQQSRVCLAEAFGVSHDWHDWSDDGAPMYRAELQYFLECVREGRQTCNSVSAATKVLNLLLVAKAWAGL